MCSQKLETRKIFCESCQADCYYRLTHYNDFCEFEEKKIFFFIEKNIYLKRIFQLAQNPRQIFLLENLISLIILTLTMPRFIYPEALLFNPIFQHRQLNQLFFKQLQADLGLILYKKTQSLHLLNKTVLWLVSSNC